MAIEYGWTGFENGEADACALAPTRGAIIGTVRARTGQYLYACYSGLASANNWAAYRRKNTTLGTGMAAGQSATTIARVFFRLVAFPVANNAPCFGVGSLSVGSNQRTALALDTTGHFAAQTPSGTGTYSASTLSLDTWYRLELTHVVTQGAGVSLGLTVTIDVRDEGGTLIETVTRTQSPIATNASLPTDVILGNGSVTAFVFLYEFDDWWWGSADGADQATLAFPLATKITRVPATAQGAAADWTGDYRTIIDAPRETVVADEQSCAATIGLTTTFVHDSAAALGITGIEGVIVRGELRTPSGGAGDEALLYNGVEYPVAIPNGAAYNNNAQEGVLYGVGVDAGFDAAEFGAINKRGVASGLRLATSYLEVLHSGPGPVTPFVNGTGPWKLNIITYVGTGTYQTIAGVGFGASVILILPITGLAADTGVWKLARAGGTLSYSWGATARSSVAVMSITSDGFILGPSTHANRSGSNYLAICIQEGDTCLSVDGQHLLSSDMYGGNEQDNRDYVMPEPFQPDLVFTQANDQRPILRTSAMVGDLSLVIDGNPGLVNQLQAVTVDGFQLGTDNRVNGVNRAYLWWAQRIIGQIADFVHVGVITPAGASFTVTGIPFSPVFVMARQAGTSGFAFWRSPLVHAGANSQQWASVNVVTTAITSITADGFTGGATISVGGTNVYWVAFAPGNQDCTPPCTGVVAGTRTDGLPYSPTTSPPCGGDGLVDGPRQGV